MSEEEFHKCMQAMAEGDTEALRLVYDAYLKVIYITVYNIVKQKEAAEDITSEFFIRLYQSAGKFRGDGHHKAWIMTIARNMCIDHIRKNSREMPVLDKDEAEEGAYVAEPSQESKEESIVTRLTVQKAMELLKEKEKAVIDMKLLGGFTFKEIAECMDMPLGTVTWHYNTGIKKLRRYLDDAG